MSLGGALSDRTLGAAEPGRYLPCTVLLGSGDVLQTESLLGSDKVLCVSRMSKSISK